MEERTDTKGVAGCLVALIGASVGFGVWLQGARPALRGGFEGERDWSLLYIELPLMLIGTPVITLAAWALTNGMLRGQAARTVRTAVSLGAAMVTLAVLAWVCHTWLGIRIDSFFQRGDA